MDKKVNNRYKFYVDKILDYFKPFIIGKGLFLFKDLKAKQHAFELNEYNRIIYMIYNMIATGLLSYKDNDKSLVILTEKGYEYKQGGVLQSNRVRFNAIIDCELDTNSKFNILWDIIGVEQYAPFYVTGPLFYNSIKPLLSDLPNTYCEYMQLMSKKGKSSRKYWFKELYSRLSKQDSYNFFEHMSKKIEEYYDMRPNSEQVKLEGFDIFTENQQEETLNMDKNGNNITISPKKRIFISYCRESEEIKKWVKKFVKDLKNEFEVYFDENLDYGSDLLKFMLQKIQESDRVLIICTPSYKIKSELNKGGVSFEYSIITQELYDNQDSTKFIPILKIGSFEESAPSYIKNKKGIDMVNDEDYEKNLRIIIEALKK